MLKAVGQRLLARILGRRLDNLAQLAHAQSVELHQTLNTKSAELHAALHTKSRELHDTLHLKSAESHDSLNVLHERVARLADDVGAVRRDRGIEEAIQRGLEALQLRQLALAEMLSAADRQMAADLSDLRQTTGAQQEAHLESLAYLGRTLRDLRDQIGGMPGGLAAEADARHSPKRLLAETRPLTGHDLHDDVRVEVPFAWQALAALAPGASVLDVGGAGSPVALSLASLGFRVTVIDVRPYPFQHPRLEVVTAPLAAWIGSARSFDAIVCVSSLERFGPGAHNHSILPGEADLTTMRQLRTLAAPGGLLVLTVPFGEAAHDPRERPYNRERLARLLHGWTVDTCTIVERQGPLLSDATEAALDDHRCVALVKARAA